MFRRPSGKLGFSFTRFVTNAVPNFASDNAERDADLSVTEKDLLWTHQIHGAEAARRSPMTLDVRSFLSGGITDSMSHATRIHSILQKLNILTRDGPTSTTTGIDISRINSSFSHNLAFISICAQRKVVGLLCFWEEEVIRWRLLDEEEEEIIKAIELSGTETEDLRVALERVRMRKGMRPSQRVGGEPGGVAGTEAALPAYSERAD